MKWLCVFRWHKLEIICDLGDDSEPIWRCQRCHIPM